MNPSPAGASSSVSSCIHCGLCLGSCPTYLETGNENLSPRGRIYLMRALENGGVELDSNHVRALDTCLGCRACETACPSGVPYGRLLEGARERFTRGFRRGWLPDLFRSQVIEGVLPFRERFELTLPPARWLQQTGAVRWLPSPLQRALGLLGDDTTPATSIPTFSKSTAGEARGRVGLLRGCVMGALFNRTHLSTLQALTAAGYDVVIPEEQGCCGALLAHTGAVSDARAQAVHNTRVFLEAKVDFVVSNAAGCGAQLKDYAHLIGSGSPWFEAAKHLSSIARDFSELMAGVPLSWQPCRYQRVTYQDACHLAHAQGVRNPPRQLVKAIAGGAFVEMPESDVCCGSAGSYNLTEPELSGRLQRRKTTCIQATEASVVVTANPGCFLQMQAGLREAGRADIKVLHLADFLAEHLPASG